MKDLNIFFIINESFKSEARDINLYAKSSSSFIIALSLFFKRAN